MDEEREKFLKFLFERRSIRKFLPGKIPKEDVLKILRAGNYAPSAGNLQARDFILIQDERRKRRIAEIAYGQWFISEASIVVVVCANLRRSSRRYGRRGKLYAIQDADAATQNILLAAHILGYGAVWIGAFDEELLREELSLPSYVRPTAIIPIGIPGETPEDPGRLPIEKILHFEVWRQLDPGNENPKISPCRR